MTLDYSPVLTHEYAVINPLDIPEEQYKDLNTLRLIPRGLDRHQKLMPLLLSLEDLSTLERMELLDRSNLCINDFGKPLFSGLLKSSVPIKTLQVHWQRITICRRLNPWGRVWLRMHDPRVFRQLCWVFDSSQLSTLMGLIECWSWHDTIEGRWHAQENPKATKNKLGVLDLSDAQWKILDEIEVLNMCLKEIHYSHGVNAYVKADPKFLIHQIFSARSAGVKDREDLCLYALQSYQFGAQIHQAAALNDCLRLAQSGEISYVSACQKIPDDAFSSELKY